MDDAVLAVMMEAAGSGAVGGVAGGAATVAGLGEVIRRYLVKPKVDALRVELEQRMISMESGVSAIVTRQEADDVRQQSTDQRIATIGDRLQQLERYADQAGVRSDALSDTLREIRRDVRELRRSATADR